MQTYHWALVPLVISNKRMKKEPMNVELIPIYISKEEFAEKKVEVQDLITRILIDCDKKKLRRQSFGSIPTTIRPNQWISEHRIQK